MSEVFSNVPEFLPDRLSPRPCKFCSSPAIYAPLEHMESFGIKIFFCYTCQAEYLYYSRDGMPTEPASTSIYAQINSQVYRWTVFADETRCSLWLVKSPGVPGKTTNQGMVYILGFSGQIPKITPNNIVSKIQNWLPLI